MNNKDSVFNPIEGETTTEFLARLRLSPDWPKIKKIYEERYGKSP